MYQTHNPNNDSNCQPTHATAAPGGRTGQGCIKLLDFSLSSIGWRRGLGRGGAFLLVSPLLGPLPTRSSRGEDGELDAALAGLEKRVKPFATERVRGYFSVGSFNYAIQSFQRTMSDETKPAYSPGLEAVIAGESPTCWVDPTAGLLDRGY